jgi:hypothetical protein
MAQENLLPSPKTTLAVILGASKYPDAQGFEATVAFAHAANSFKQYLLATLDLPQKNVCDLFDSIASPSDIEKVIAAFVHQRLTVLDQAGTPARDMLLYYVGHGSFTPDNQYSLLLRYTQLPGPPSSRLLMSSLASTLKECARKLRRVLILDCCFAGTAVRYQSGEIEYAHRQIKQAFEEPDRGRGLPTRGTCLLCSSSKDQASILASDGSTTAFAQSFLHVLHTGNAYLAGDLSLHTVRRLTEDYLHEHYYGRAPYPEIHSLDQSEGIIEDLPYFPNAARRDNASAPTSLQTTSAYTSIVEKDILEVPSDRQNFAGHLVVVKSGSTGFTSGTQIELKLPLTLGSNKDNSVVLKSNFISPYHARILYKDRELWVEDLNSSKGTAIDGYQVLPQKPMLFKANQTLIIGDVWLVLTK